MMRLAQSISFSFWAHCVCIHLVVYGLSKAHDFTHCAIVSWLDVPQLTLDQVFFTLQVELCSFLEVFEILVSLFEIIISWLVAL